MGASAGDTYPDLPLALQAFFPSAALAIPESIRTTMRMGWDALPEANRRRLVERLEREQNLLLRVVLANITATRAVLGTEDKPSRELSDNAELLRQSTQAYQDRRRAMSDSR